MPRGAVACIGSDVVEKFATRWLRPAACAGSLSLSGRLRLVIAIVAAAGDAVQYVAVCVSGNAALCSAVQWHALAVMQLKKSPPDGSDGSLCRQPLPYLAGPAS